MLPHWVFQSSTTWFRIPHKKAEGATWVHLAQSWAGPRSPWRGALLFPLPQLRPCAVQTGHRLFSVDSIFHSAPEAHLCPLSLGGGVGVV